MKNEILKVNTFKTARIVFMPDDLGMKYRLQSHSGGRWHSVEWFDSFYQAIQYWERHRVEERRS